MYSADILEYILTNQLHFFAINLSNMFSTVEATGFTNLLGTTYTYQIEDQVGSTFTKQLQNYYGMNSEPRIHEAIDYIQKNVSFSGK